MATLRPATRADLTAINDIVNHYIRETTVNWSWSERPMAEAEAWFAGHGGPRYPVYVVEEEGEVVAFGSLSPMRPKDGYWPVAENTLYVRPDCRGRGLGRLLMERLIADGRAAGLWAISAWITDDNETSIRLHQKLGFYENGRLVHIGEKFGQPLSVVILQLDLQKGME